MADTVPGTVPNTVPDTVPDTVTDTVPGTVADTVPATVADTVHDTVPELGCRIKGERLPGEGDELAIVDDLQELHAVALVEVDELRRGETLQRGGQRSLEPSEAATKRALVPVDAALVVADEEEQHVQATIGRSEVDDLRRLGAVLDRGRAPPTARRLTGQHRPAP